MRKEQTGGVVMGKEKIWSISYTDDIMLLAKSEQELKGMMKRFRKYTERKGLILSSKKSKEIVLDRRRRRALRKGNESEAQRK